MIATSVQVGRLFSRSRILISHLRSRLSAQTTRALLCLGDWSLLELVDDDDMKKVVSMEETQGIDTEMQDGWDRIQSDY